MNNRIIYDNYNFDNYKFDISLGESDVKIKICDTLSTDIFECMVNENDTNKHSVFKFCKLLICGLSKEKDFIFQITKIPDKIKCKITYKNDFLDEEYTEVFTANKIEETQIEKLEKQIVKLTAHINNMDNRINMLVKENNELNKLKEEINKLFEHINKMDNRFNMLVTENNELKEKIKTMEYIEVPEELCFMNGNKTFYKFFPVNNNKMEIVGCCVNIIPNDIFFKIWECPINYLLEPPREKYFSTLPYDIYILNLYKRLDIKKIKTFSHYCYNKNTEIDKKFDCLDKYLSFTNCIFEEIEINIEVMELYSCVNKYIGILQKYSNYKKIIIKIKNGSYDERSFENHCKKNNIELIQEYA